jgi:3',5'-cyclic AMP phosphodiesterase CpdA
MKFIHISDLHFQALESDNEAATSRLHFINKNYPDHNLIVTGDIADNGNEEEFAWAYKALVPFKGRIYIVPGNHDFGLLGNSYSRKRAERFDKMLSIPMQQGGTFAGDNLPVVYSLMDEFDKVMLIALDTNIETKDSRVFAQGQVGKRQLSFLKTNLPKPEWKDRTKILFFHHHPFFNDDWTSVLLDAEELMQTIYKLVDVVCFGHQHVSGLWPDREGIKYILAADNLGYVRKDPPADTAREIIIMKGDITVKDINVIPTST